VTTQQVSAQPLRRQSRLRAMTDFYVTTMRTQVQTQFQYRAATYMYLVGMVAEPVIYLVVWTTIAEQNGGTVGGLTTGQLAAYYIVWTLVRNMNIVFTPYGWEWRIRNGELSSALLRPLHPIHYDIAQFAGGKVIWVLLYLPIAAALTLIFDPTFSVTPLEVGVFLIAIWGAYLIRTMMLWLLGMVTIWTTRGSAIFETYLMAELLLSGRLVPMTLMPEWAQTLASFLPFQWAFYFPIQTLVGDLSTAQLIGGLGMQALWIGIGSFLVWVCFRASVKHYTAVGN
jgi:ABC-2 type transport system permease protein